MEKNTIGVALGKEVCRICGKEVDGPIFMNTVLTEHNAKEVEKLHGKVIGLLDKPCEDCEKKADGKIIIVEIDGEKTEDKNNPWKTGRICYMSSVIISPEVDTSKGMLYCLIEDFEKIINLVNNDLKTKTDE